MPANFSCKFGVIFCELMSGGLVGVVGGAIAVLTALGAPPAKQYKQTASSHLLQANIANYLLV